MTYLVDSDVFIQAKNLHYGLDFCPAFWEWLIDQDTDGLYRTWRQVHDALRDAAARTCALRPGDAVMSRDAAETP
jgi:hypothetical protein